ncbi:ankyrin repeat and LEM domain-containing protein 2-like isoform X2 [Mya arenaria]|uniref:ankyrin repeat and LEM domain-containing protein 2-like isoform X2 n=1 Tax=Mya arenaria TaxID=6604 RepID=UPI0022E90A0B|nr:ankyrin repeat and LEM domain-containing protein 2-like isoform X2 [Mya arenaria]
MDQVLEQVKQYDIKTLREKLLENGIKVGPIAPSSAFLFQKRLAKHLFLQQGGKLDDEDGEPKPNLACPKPVIERQEPAFSSELTSKLAPDQADVFYAVCLPDHDEVDGAVLPEGERVFTEKTLALNLAKKVKGSRFKVFKSQHDASVFSKLKADSVLASPRRPKEDGKENKVSTESSPFKGPKPQDLAQLRRCIELGDVETFKSTVWNNPRFLVSSGDTPAIYQEGPRYTAMHVAALKNQPAMCQAILDILEDPEFVRMLYSLSVNTEESMSSRVNFLVDMYLNMPDKGNCDAPLHMACKFGFDKVVEVLAAHPKTDKQLKNKWGDSPRDLICSRCSVSSTALRERIGALLLGQCYVPLIRSEDNTSTPLIGQPWSPDVTMSPLDNPRVPCSPRESPMSVRACAGPMSPSDAEIFHRKWTTPPAQSPHKEEYFNLKRSDSEKGYERIGRKLASEMHIPWNEYWEFLDQFVDVTSPQGLQALEDFLARRVWATFVREYKDKHCIVDDVLDSGLQSGLVTPVVDRSRVSSSSQNSAKSLYHDFMRESKKSMDSFEDSVKDGVDEVDGAVGEVVKESNDQKAGDSFLSGSDVVSPMTNLAKKFAKLNFLDESLKDQESIDDGNQSMSKPNDSNDESDNITDFNSNVEQKSEKQASSVQPDSDKQNDIKSVADTVNEEEDGSNTVESKTTKTKIESIEQNDASTSEDQTIKNKPELQLARIRSISSGSTGSFQTAVDESDSSQSFCSQMSDPGSDVVCVRISCSKAFQTLLDYVNDYLSENFANSKASTNSNDSSDIETSVHFILQWKLLKGNESQTVSIVSLDISDLPQKLLLLENVGVAAVEGDITSKAEGEVVEIGASSGEKTTVMAYLTRAETLPKCGYIHGPQRTKVELDVCHALWDTITHSSFTPSFRNIYSFQHITYCMASSRLRKSYMYFLPLRDQNP